MCVAKELKMNRLRDERVLNILGLNGTHPTVTALILFKGVSMNGFAKSFFCIVKNVKDGRYDIITLGEYLHKNHCLLKAKGSADWLMVEGLFSCKKDVETALKEMTEPELVLKGN
jgi:hypothetical protein